MITLLLFLAIYFVGFFLLFLILRWVYNKHPKWRTPAAFIVELGSAYSASFPLDMLLQSTIGNLEFGNVAAPLVTWASIAISCHYLARQVVITNRVLSVAYFIIGAVAMLSAFVHGYNFFVGLPLILIGLILLRSRRHTLPTIEESQMNASPRENTNTSSQWRDKLAGCNYTTARNDIARMFAMARQEAESKGGEYVYKQELADAVQPFLANPCFETTLNLLNAFPQFYSFFEMSKPQWPFNDWRT